MVNLKLYLRFGMLINPTNGYTKIILIFTAILDGAMHANSKYPDMDEFIELCRAVSRIVRDEPNILRINSQNVLIVGDIHGDHDAMERIMNIQCNYDHVVFLGDYVDRGPESVRCLYDVMTLKIQNPNRITMLRGNHEDLRLNVYYGFMDEILTLYGEKEPGIEANKMFRFLPYCAVINNKIFAVHGGISSKIKNINDINKYKRGKYAVPKAIAELLWNDPRNGINGFVYNTNRGGFYFFGEDALTDFLSTNGLQMIIRSHEYASEGFWYMWDRKLLTIFTTGVYIPWASNTRCVAAVKNLDIRVLSIDEVK